MEATPPVAPPPGASAPAPADYPVQYEVEMQEEYHRFLPLIKWLLVIPHLIVILFLGIGVFLAKIIAFFAVLFTAQYPRGLFDYELGVRRWLARVGAYMGLLRDEYPPFSLGEEPQYGVHLRIDYPERVERWRPFFAFILAIPYLFVTAVLGYVAAACVVIAFFAILFTKKVPAGLGRLIIIAGRWQNRGNAYAGYMSVVYPPWDLD